MANPMWVAGGKSANPSGRPKTSTSETMIRRMVANFIKRNIKPNRLSRILDELSAAQQADLLVKLMPYAIAPKKADGLGEDEINKLYEMVQQALENKEHGKAI